METSLNTDKQIKKLISEIITKEIKVLDAWSLINKVFNRIDEKNKYDFLKNLILHIEEISKSNEFEMRIKFTLNSIKFWTKQYLKRMEFPEISIFEDLYNEILINIWNATNDYQVNFILKSALEKTPNKTEYIEILKTEVEKLKNTYVDYKNEIEKLTDIKVEEEEFVIQTEYNERIEYLYKILNNKDFINEINITNENDSESTIIPETEIQKVYIMIKLGLFKYLINHNEFKITEPKAFKLLESITGIKSETIRKVYQDYKTAQNGRFAKNNPDTSHNQKFFIELLNLYKISKTE